MLVLCSSLLQLLLVGVFAPSLSKQICVPFEIFSPIRYGINKYIVIIRQLNTITVTGAQIYFVFLVLCFSTCLVWACGLWPDKLDNAEFYEGAVKKLWWLLQ